MDAGQFWEGVTYKTLKEGVVTSSLGVRNRGEERLLDPYEFSSWVVRLFHFSDAALHERRMEIPPVARRHK